ncbi:MAG: hypothetical protein HFG51_14650 [Lachnospiraceae bacterium]|nr:hypothetical protein [Lachnospiraceae bacterium]
METRHKLLDFSSSRRYNNGETLKTKTERVAQPETFREPGRVEAWRK